MDNFEFLKINPKLPSANRQMHFDTCGFSAVEVIVVVCIIGVLMLTAVKQYRIYTFQARITEALASVHGIRLDVEEYYMFYGRWPQSSRDLRDPTMNIDYRNQSTHRITLENGGAINIWFINMPGFSVPNPVLTVRPVLAGGDGRGIISWICGNSAAPENAIVWGENQSNIPERFLGKVCR